MRKSPCHFTFKFLSNCDLRFAIWWQNLAAEFVGDPGVIFDLNNEPYGIPATDAAALMQAGINGVRASGATQLILVQGTSWTGAWSMLTHATFFEPF
jgi:endoglucanase